MRRRAGTMTRADRGEPPGVDVHVDRPGTLCSYIGLDVRYVFNVFYLINF